MPQGIRPSKFKSKMVKRVGMKKMRASRGVNLWLTQRAIALGFVCGRKRPNSEALRHKERVEAYFLLDFLFLFYQEKRMTNYQYFPCKRYLDYPIDHLYIDVKSHLDIP
jgi:hypothetical protein